MITALTPTGARPEAFAACVDQMRAQTARGCWVIVDDGPEPMPTPDLDGWFVLHVQRHPLWQPGENTQALNLLRGLDLIKDLDDPRVAIIEDDDEYAPDWLETCDRWLNDADLVGESHSLYRHRETGRETACNNERHASLCSTTVKGAGVAALAKVCKTGAKFIDLRLWADKSLTKALHKPNPRRVTGIKGWPGREGIGIGHRLK